ncbi:MAG TPA: DUF1152 domain-containing protein [Solirubrobacteraceae bacterium]
MGIGGGGDVVGALAVADLARDAGLEAHVGGVTWERRPIDPLPGPRTLDEADGLLERLDPAAALAGPDTVGPGGFRFAESHMARHLGEPVVLIDPNAGPRGVAAGLEAAARRLGCDAVALVDVGGDVLGHGGEAGLASPLCDAVLLAASVHLALPSVGAVFGPGCDGELSPSEVLERIAEVAAADGLLGAWGLTPAAVERLAAAVAEVPTEASAQAIECARGGFGPSPIREGRRSVELSPVGAVTFFFDPAAAMGSAARLATAVVEADSLQAAQDILAERGVRTELDYEREHA